MIFSGPVEFDEEKISLASLTGPASDVSGGSEGKPASLSGASGVILNVTQPSTSTASNASAAASSSSGIHPNAGLAGSSAGATNSSSGRKANRLSIQGLNVATSMTSLMKMPESFGTRSSSGRMSSTRNNSRSLLNLLTSSSSNSTSSAATNHNIRQGIR